MTSVDMVQLKQLIFQLIFLSYPFNHPTNKFIRAFLISLIFYYKNSHNNLYFIMIQNVRLLRFLFARGKLRRQHIPLDQNLKDITSAQTFQRQIQAHRQKFESGIPDLTLTEALAQKKPKLGQRFKVDRKQLQKNLRKQIKKQLKMQRIIPAAQGEQFQNLQSKSHIYDQKAQIQFEQKFRKQLFRKRQTNRLIQKEKNDFHNYLTEPKNEGFVQYEENLKRLKNSKIGSMMNFRRNNEQLRLLIDSGYMDSPENLAIVLDKMSDTQRIEHYDGEKSQENSKMLRQVYQQKNDQSEDSKQMTQIETEKKGNELTPEIAQMHEKMLKNTEGPSQLRNPKLLQQFFETLKTSTQIQRQKAQEDLHLMKSIKEFEAQTFESRYNTLNFRFKGQVDFSWMKQNQLLSYIKTQKNLSTQPQQLLSMYIQNRNKHNKFSQPIITPTIMSRIYSVCSLYEFPQTDMNNRINMLNDKKYVDLQRNLFMNLGKLSDQSFADAVFGYARNHKDQQGLLNVKMSTKVMKAIWGQLKQRVTSMQQQDLGLVLRSVINTPLMKSEELEWPVIIQSLSQRLPLMEKDYEIESVLSFLTLVPVSERAVEVVAEHVGRMRDYKWEAKQTLQCYLQCSAYLIRHKGYFSPARASKTIQHLKHTFVSKHQQLMPITQTLSINTMPQLLSIIYYFDKSKQAQAKFEIQVPNKLINKCKREIIDNVRMQKELIKKQTVGGVLMAMGMVDYCKELARRRNDGQEIDLNVLEISTQKSLFCFRPLPFNSINYFTYHQLAKLTSTQIPHLPIRSIVQSLFAISLVRYKNEGIIQDMMSKIVQKIHHQIKQSKLSQDITHLRYTKEYMMLVCCFHHTRMTNAYYYHFVDVVRRAPLAVFVKLEANLIVRFFQTIVTLSFTTKENHQQDYHIIKHFAKIFHLTYQQAIKPCLSVLSKYELLVLNYVQHMFAYLQGKTIAGAQKQYKQQCEEVTKELEKFAQKFTLQDQYLTELTKIVSNMTSSLANQNQIQPKAIITPTFQSVQSRYYQHFIPAIMDQQQQIGSQYKYQTIYENVRKKLIKQYSASEVIPKTWRIEIPHKKEVYFITTYEHLFANHDQDNTTVKLFGFWKVYQELYTLNNWKFKYVCTFLQG